MPADAPSLNVR